MDARKMMLFAFASVLLAGMLINVSHAAVPLMAGTVTASATPYIIGNPQDTLTANPSGGDLPYSYQWYYTTSSAVAGTTCGTGSWSLAGVYTSTYGVTPNTETFYCYQVSDSSKPTQVATSQSYDLPVETGAAQCGLLPTFLTQELQSEVPWYCPINAQIYQVWSADLPFVGAVVLIAITIAALIFMAGIALRSDRIRNFGIGEFYEALASAIIIGLFMYLCAVMFGLGPGIAVGGINPYATAFDLITTTISQAQGLYNVMFQTYMIDSYWASISYSINIEDRPIASTVLGSLQLTYVLPLEILFLQPASILAAILIDGIAGLYAQYYLLVFFSVAAIPAFLVPGVVLRAFIPTRALGGILISIAIAFYLVMPTLFAVAYYFTAPSIISAFATSQAQLNRWGTGTGAQTNAETASSPLALAISGVQADMSTFWLLVLFYPAMIIALSYAFITQVANFIGGASRIGGKLRGFV